MTLVLSKANLLAEEAQAYITAYNAKFVDAPVGKGHTYLDRFIFKPSEGVDERATIVRFPIPLTAVELRLFKGRSRFAKGSTKYIEVAKNPYQAGQHEYYKLIVDPAWTGFEKPERLRKLVTSWPTRNAAAIINAGDSTAYWKGTNFLSASTPSNPFKKGSPNPYRTFWASTPLDYENVQAMLVDLTNRRDLEGDVIPSGNFILFASAALFPTALSIAVDPLIPGTNQSNPVKKWNMTAESWPDLDPSRWGIINADAAEEYPLFMSVQGTEDFMTYGRESAMFEQKKHMGYELLQDLGIAAGRNESFAVADTL